MTTMATISNCIPDQRVRNVLGRLHDEARRNMRKAIWGFVPYLPQMLSGRKLPWNRLQFKHDTSYLAVSPAGGIFLYLLVRAIGARRIVEFGTSFGVSTIYLALGVRDNGGGLVIGTEMVPTKAASARNNIQEAGLGDVVEIREGNALESLKDLAGPVDFLLSDGWPQYALPVLQLVAPKMRHGAVVVNHNVVGLRGDHAEYLAYLRDPSNGFVSGSMTLAGEFSVRVLQPAAGRVAQPPNPK
jgi:predicted O-methyltransferase YrrM